MECTHRGAPKAERWEAAGWAAQMAIGAMSAERDYSVRAEKNVEKEGKVQVLRTSEELDCHLTASG